MGDHGCFAAIPDENIANAQTAPAFQNSCLGHDILRFRFAHKIDRTGCRDGQRSWADHCEGDDIESTVSQGEHGGSGHGSAWPKVLVLDLHASLGCIWLDLFYNQPISKLWKLLLEKGIQGLHRHQRTFVQIATIPFANRWDVPQLLQRIDRFRARK